MCTFNKAAGSRQLASHPGGGPFVAVTPSIARIQQELVIRELATRRQLWYQDGGESKRRLAGTRSCSNNLGPNELGESSSQRRDAPVANAARRRSPTTFTGFNLSPSHN